MPHCGLTANPHDPRVTHRGRGEQVFGLVELTEVEGELDPKCQRVEVGAGERLEDVFDVRFRSGPFQEELDQARRL